MNLRKADSVYAVGRRHMLYTLVAIVTIIWGIPLTLSALGVSFNATGLVIMPLAAGLMLINGIRSMLIACPRCGKSLFMRGFVSVPWPARRCSRCGIDLTAVTRP